MGNNLGKWFYVSNKNEAAKPSTRKLLRLMNMREVDGETVCDTTVNLKIAMSDDYISGPVVKADYLLNNYASITPHLVTYWIQFKDAPAFDSLYTVIEPYDLEGEDGVAAAFSVYPHLSSPDCTDNYVFAWHKRMDAVEYLRDIKGYKEYEAGPPGAVYLNDKGRTILSFALYHWGDVRHYGWHWCVNRLLENRDTFAKLANVKISEVMQKRKYWGMHMLETKLQTAQRIFLNLMPISNDEILSIRDFVESHDLNKTGCLQALTKLLRFKAKSNDVSEDEVVNDLVFQKSIIIMPYSMALDLEKIKSNNRLYTLVLAQTTDTPIEAYVIMYRQAPVEFRQPQQTGFSTDEMSKLLR